MRKSLRFIVSLFVLAVLVSGCGNKSGTTTGKDSTNGMTTSKETSKESSTQTSKGQTAQKISGKGNKSETVNLNAGLAAFDITNNAGFSNFSVWLKDANGKNVSLLANESGTWTGSVLVKIPADGKYMIDVVSEGSWSVGVK